MSEQTAESELNKPPAPQGQVVSPTPAIDTAYSDATDSGRPTLRLKAAEQEQHESWQLIALALDAAGMGWGAWNPVSYTHLDVYKRQVLPLTVALWSVTWPAL